MGMEVLKFGGSSLVSAEAMTRVRDVLLARRDQQRIVVCSAMGGVTNELIRIGLRASRGDRSFLPMLDELENRHQSTMTALGFSKDSALVVELNEGFAGLRSLCDGISLISELSAKSMDQLVSHGERFAVSMVHAWLVESGLKMRRVDARNWITTNDRFGAAEVDVPASELRIKQDVEDDLDFEILITEGFIGSNAAGETTTLGRGGSDYSASLIASAINAVCMEKSTDVTGMMTADPRIVEDAQVIEEMSYEEAMELCHFGAKVIYHPTIAPLRGKGIPLVVRSTFDSDSPGTRIVSNPASKAIVRGLSSLDGIALLTMEGGSLIGRPGFASRIFSALAQASVNATFITQSSSENSLTIGIAESDLEAGLDSLKSDLMPDVALGRLEPIQVDRELSIIALVGGGMVSEAGVSGAAFKALGDAGVNIRAIAQGSTERNISIVVASSEVTRALRALHGEFFQSQRPVIQVFCAGIGQVGSAFVRQFLNTKHEVETRLSMEIRLIGIANSRHYKINKQGLTVEALSEIQNGTKMDSINEAFDAFSALPSSERVWIDNTASFEVASTARAAIERGWAYICSNKIAATGKMEDWDFLTKGEIGQRQFRNETNVGAALPIIRTLKGMAETGDRMHRIEAVLSGSLNFIFSGCDQGNSFSTMVERAQSEGYTEPDPRLDLSGTDVARKLLILARLSGAKMELEDVAVEGFLPKETLEGTAEDFMKGMVSWSSAMDDLVAAAANRGNRLRFVASWSAKAGCVCSLRELEPDHPFFGLDGTDNAVSIESDRYQGNPLVIQGAGAGAELTASGVLSDLYDLAGQRAGKTRGIA